MSAKKQIEILDLGLVDYREAFRRQEDLVQQIIEKKTSEKIIFCSHPPIVTLGRGTKSGDVFAWQGDTLEVNRGGRATYHGPSQIIAYPLISLGGNDDFYTDKKIPPRDLHQYMRLLEQSVQLLLSEMGLASQTHAVQKQVGAVDFEEATGVWVGDQKVAAIGIAAKKWITSHGVALNVEHDELAFQGFYPCGFQTSQVTSLENLLHKKTDRDFLKARWGEILQALLIIS
jgi:lipoyl(octanoyl) transferase